MAVSDDDGTAERQSHTPGRWWQRLTATRARAGHQAHNEQVPAHVRTVDEPEAGGAARSDDRAKESVPRGWITFADRAIPASQYQGDEAGNLVLSDGLTLSTGWLEANAPRIFAQLRATDNPVLTSALLSRIEGGVSLDEQARGIEWAYNPSERTLIAAELTSSYYDETDIGHALDAYDATRSSALDEAEDLAWRAYGLLSGELSKTDIVDDLSRASIADEMAAEDPHAALRADVLTAVVAADHDPAELRREIEFHGVDLARMAPALAPASDFYARHTPAIEAHLRREISARGFRDLPSYVASWRWGRPATASLHDTEQALVEHVVGDVIASVDDGGRDVRDAHRMWERAADRAAIREWSAALERGDLELGVELLRGPEQQLELGLHVDVEHDVDAGHDAEQEVG